MLFDLSLSYDLVNVVVNIKIFLIIGMVVSSLANAEVIIV